VQNVDLAPGWFNPTQPWGLKCLGSDFGHEPGGIPWRGDWNLDAPPILSGCQLPADLFNRLPTLQAGER
jgi:hypothetical protein